jgi:hypothetical protein
MIIDNIILYEMFTCYFGHVHDRQAPWQQQKTESSFRPCICPESREAVTPFLQMDRWTTEWNSHADTLGSRWKPSVLDSIPQPEHLFHLPVIARQRLPLDGSGVLVFQRAIAGAGARAQREGGAVQIMFRTVGAW